MEANRCDGATDSREWLFDMTWGKGDKSSKNYFCEMPFIMECEWNKDRGEIFRDFEKLLIAKAPHKLFIYEQDDDPKVDEVAKDLYANIVTFKMKMPEERYLLAGWSGESKRFICNSVILRKKYFS